MKNLKYKIYLLLIVLFGSLVIAYAVEQVNENRVIYVSSSQGNDSNNGYSEHTPVKTLENALKMGRTIKLKAGDIFYGNLDACGKTIGKYGVGDNPVICGFKRINTPKWKNVDGNIWRICLSEDNYTGASIANGESLLNNVGCIYEYDKDEVHGRKVQYKHQLKEDWDFWQTEHITQKETTAADFNWLYLYYKGNPNLLKLEFTIGKTGVHACNTKLSYIDIKGFGRCGIAALSNCLFEHCNLDVIGGMTFIGYESYTSLGNGIEFYVNSDIKDSEVRFCSVSRCYDCGISIQATGCGKSTPSNIFIHHNLIENCCQGWEDFLRNDDDVMFENCRFSDNLLIENGEKTGFGYPASRFKYCQILGNNFNGDRGMIIENNTMIDGNYFCANSYKGKYTSNIWKGNVCYLREGMWILSNYNGSADVIRLSEEIKNEAIIDYRNITNDSDTKFIILSDRKIKILKNKERKRFLKKNNMI